MGDGDLGEYDEIKEIAKKKREKLKNQASFKSFQAAVDTATQALEEHAEEFDDEDNTDYQLVDIAAARSEGIMPLAFTRNETEGTPVPRRD
jgi:hypothetical protein